MSKVIRVTQTKIFEYEPDFNSSDYYTANNVDTLEKALEVDQNDYNEGQVDLEQLVYNPPQIKTVWEIVDDGLPG